MRWEGWVWLGWIAGFGVLEGFGLARTDGAMTLTYFLENHVPKWILACALGWLNWHFLVAPLAKR